LEPISGSMQKPIEGLISLYAACFKESIDIPSLCESNYQNLPKHFYSRFPA
jgi:hypothetical protein